jgi:hypothetical protein
MNYARLTDMGHADFTEVFHPKPVGERVNTHVVPAVREPLPDYDAMQRTIENAPAQVDPKNKK